MGVAWHETKAKRGRREEWMIDDTSKLHVCFLSSTLKQEPDRFRQRHH